MSTGTCQKQREVPIDMIRVVNDALGPVEVAAPLVTDVANGRSHPPTCPSSMTSSSLLPAISKAHGIITLFNPEISSPHNYEWN